MKLNLGCGPVQPAGWVNIDGSNRAWLASRLNWLDALLVRLGAISPTEFGPQTTYGNLFKPLPYAAGSVDCIYAGELWEHMELPDAERLTAECFRVLKPGGVLRLCVPDGEAFARDYLRRIESGDAKACRDYIALYFRHIATKPLRPFQSWGHTHKWQWDEPQMVDLLRSHGFVDVERRKFHDSRIPDVALVERTNELIVEGVKGTRSQ